MHERVAQLVDHALVELGFLAGQLERHAFAELTGDVANGTLEPVEERADGNHPCAQDAALEIVCDTGELIDRLDEFGIPTMSLVPQAPLLFDLLELCIAGCQGPLDRPGGGLEDRIHGLTEGIHGVA